jgi:hypothetical protein
MNKFTTQSATAAKDSNGGRRLSLRQAARRSGSSTASEAFRERVTTLSLEATGQRVDSMHLAERLCPVSLLNPYNILWRARGQEGSRRDCGGCEIRSVKTRHNTNYIKRGNVKRAQGVQIILFVASVCDFCCHCAQSSIFSTRPLDPAYASFSLLP